MLKNKKLLSIISITSVLLVSIIGYSFYMSNSNKTSFSNGGFILSNQSNDNASNALTAEYFEAGESYSIRWPDKVLFKNNAGENVTVTQSNFVHYSNGDLMALSDGVVIDSEALDQSPITYYTIKSGTVLSKVNDGYEMMSGNTKVKLKSFIWKISSSKYMVVSDQIKFRMAGSDKHDFQNYVEVEFVDGDIVKVGDDKKTFRSLSPDSVLLLNDGISLNLDNKAVFQGDQRVLNLQQMLIGANDNVELSETPQNGSTNGNDDNNGNNDNNNNNGSNSNNENNNNSNSDNRNPNQSDNQENSGKDQNFDFGLNGDGSSEDDSSTNGELVPTVINTPSFNITSFTTNAIGFTAKISVTDTSFLLSQPYTVEVIETETQRQVAEAGPFPTTQYEITASSEALKPNKEYRMLLKAKYKYKGEEYEEQFLSRTFVTNSIGLGYSKISASDSSLTFKVKIDPSSLVSGAELVLSSNDGLEVDRQIINRQDAQSIEGQLITFNSLSSNTIYAASLENVTYDGSQITVGFDTGLQVITLKSSPNVGTVIVTLDKIAGSFDLSVNGFYDPQGGLIKARYEVYSPSDLTVPIETISKDNLSIQSIRVDGHKIFRNTFYVFRVIYEYNDNEKVVEYSTPVTDPASLTGGLYPSFTFSPTDIKFDSFAGNIEIDNTGGTLITTVPLTYTVKNSTAVNIPGGNITIPTASAGDPQLSLSFSLNGLRANESHVVQLFGTVDLQDGNPQIPNSYLGSFVVTTKQPTPFTVSYTKDAPQTSHAFSIDLKLEDTIISGNKISTDYEAQKIKNLGFELYSGTDKIPSKRLGSYEVVNSGDNDNTNTIKMAFYDKASKITEASFGLNQSNFKPIEYTVFVTKTIDYTTFKNNIGVETSTQKFTFRPIVTIPTLDFNNAYSVNLVRNRDLTPSKPDLNPDTIVALDITPRFDNSNQIVNNYTITPYLVVNSSSAIELTALAKNVVSTGVTLPTTRMDIEEGLSYPTGNNPPSGNMITALRRGYTYYFKFTAQLDLDGDGTAETNYPLSTATSIAKSTNQQVNKQEPSLVAEVKNSTSSRILSKVTLDDVDSSLENKRVYVKKGSTTNYFVLRTPVSGTTNVYDVTFNVSSGLNVFGYDQKLQFGNSFTSNNKLSYNYQPDLSINSLNYSYTVDSQNLTISVEGVSGATNILNKIAVYDITLTENTGSGSPVEYKFENQTLDANNRKIIPLIDISSLRGKNFTIKIEAYLDNEDIIQDNLTSTSVVDERYTIAVMDSTGNYRYAFFDPTINRINTKTTATNSIFQGVTMNTTTSTLSFQNVISSSATNNIAYSNGFLYFRGKLNSGDLSESDFMVKKLSKHQISIKSGISSDVNFGFNIPTVSVVRLTPVLGSVKVQFNILYGLHHSEMKDHKVYVEAYKNGNASGNPVSTLEYTLSGTDTSAQQVSVDFNGFDLGRTYSFKIYSNLNNGSAYTKKYLLDSDNNVDGRVYTVNTQTNMTINGGSHTVVANETDKNVVVSFSLSAHSGFSKLVYSLSELNSNGSTTATSLIISEDQATSISSNTFSKTLIIDSSKGFEFGKKYRFTITAKNFDSPTPGDITSYNYDFALSSLISPFASGNYNRTNTGHEFRLSVNDPNGTIRTKQYSVEVKDDTDAAVTITGVTDSNHNVADKNKQLSLTGLQDNKEYKLIVTMNADLNWNNNDIEIKREFVFTTIADSSVSLGKVFFNLKDDKLIVAFEDYVNISNISTFGYTIYDPDGQMLTATNQNFNSKVDGSSRIIEIPYTAVKKGAYNIQMQFFNNSTQVASYSGFFRKFDGTFFSITNLKPKTEILGFLERKLRLI